MMTMTPETKITKNSTTAKTTAKSVAKTAANNFTQHSDLISVCDSSLLKKKAPTKSPKSKTDKSKPINVESIYHSNKKKMNLVTPKN